MAGDTIALGRRSHAAGFRPAKTGGGKIKRAPGAMPETRFQWLRQFAI
jgi:hypothetical protein